MDMVIGVKYTQGTREGWHSTELRCKEFSNWLTDSNEIRDAKDLLNALRLPWHGTKSHAWRIRVEVVSDDLGIAPDVAAQLRAKAEEK